MGSNSSYSELDLFERIAKGDEQAYKQVFDANYVNFVSYAAKLLHSDLWAEEIVQDVFLKLWKIRDTLGAVENPGGFLNRMVFNRVRDHFKHQQHEIKLQHYLRRRAENYAPNSTQDSFDYRLGEQLFEEAVSKLPKQRATIFRMRHEQGLSYDEIARELNISKFTVRNLLNLALQNIRTYLLEHGDITGIISLLLIFLIFF